MGQPRGFGLNGTKYLTNIAVPQKVSLQFKVAPADSGGFGITSLKSNGYVANVFMNTSATPATGSPNPAAGYALIVLNNNFNKFIAAKASFQPPVTGSQLAVTSGLTAGNVYVIDALGTTTTAEWQSIGVPPGFTPAVGMSFVATATGTSGSHTGKVKAVGISKINNIEVQGDPNQSISNSAIAVNNGAQVLLAFMAPTSSSVTTPVPTAPTTGTVIDIDLYFDGSSVTVDGL